MSRPVLKRFTSPLLLIGFFFLINPTISLLDVFPDFIGYFCIWLALSELRVIDDRLEFASQKLLYLTFLSIIRALAFVFSAGSSSSTQLMLCFTFAVAEGILGVLCINDFFGGFEYLFERHGNIPALKMVANSRFLTLLFTLVRIVLGVLPEFVAILELEAYANVDAEPVLMDLVSYKPYLILLFASVVLVFGIVWYVDICKFFRTTRRDSDFLDELTGQYQSYFVAHPLQKVLTSLRAASFCAVLGFVFYLSIHVDGIAILPAAVGTFSITLAAVFLNKIRPTRSLTRYAVIAAIGQIVYELCVFLLSDETVQSFSDLLPLNVSILAVACVINAISFITFCSRAEESFESFFFSCSCKPRAGARKAAFILLSVWLLTESLTVLLPMLRTSLATVNLLLNLAFIIVCIRVYLLSAEDAATALDDTYTPPSTHSAVQ